MSPFAHLGGAALGWLDLISGDRDGARRFENSGDALASATLFYLLVVVGTLLLQALVYGGDWLSLWIAGLLSLVPLLGLIVATWGSAALVNLPLLPVLVAEVFALSFMRVIRFALLVFLPQVANTAAFDAAMLGVFGFLFYRAARLIGHAGVATAIAFAVISVAMLVLPSAALYMLVPEGPSPAGA